MTSPSLRTIGALIVVAALLLGIGLSNLALTYNLGFFLPPPSTDAQRVLIERLGQGPGTQLIFAVLPKTDAATAQQVASNLRKQSGIARVLPEASSPDITRLPQAIWQNRLLLTDLPESVEAWQETLEERSMDAMVADDSLLDLIAADPSFASINALEAATSATSKPAFENNGDRYLLIQTASGAFDLDEQQKSVNAVRATLTELDQTGAKLYGSGVYGVDLQAFVQRESIIFSALASFALAALILFRFRNAVTALAVGTPLLVGGALGIAVLALAFDEVHGITLAFGFTLLGVAIDYPLHLFSRPDTGKHRSIWPTLGLGIGSTLVAYLAFIVSGTSGMQQLGVFATAGIIGAAASAFVLNKTRSASNTHNADAPAASTELSTPEGTQFSANQLLWILCIGACGLWVTVLSDAPLFSNNLSDLTPVPRATLAEDAELRTSMGVADLRYLISVRDSDQNQLLRKLEQLTEELDQKVSAGTVSSYQSISSLLPSAERQKRRQQIARNLLRTGNFVRAVESSEFDIEAFEPFVQELERVANAVTPALLKSDNPQIASLVDSLLYQSGDMAHVALVFLRGIAKDSQDPAKQDSTALAELESTTTQISGAEFVDLKPHHRFLFVGGAFVVRHHCASIGRWFGPRLRLVLQPTGSIDSRGDNHRGCRDTLRTIQSFSVRNLGLFKRAVVARTGHHGRQRRCGRIFVSAIWQTSLFRPP